MKNLSALFVGVSLLSAYASARTYHCTYIGGDSSNDFGREFTATVPASNANIRLTGTAQGEVTGPLDEDYHPINRNAGSIRFHSDVLGNSGGGTGCDSADVILNRRMAQGYNGQITIGYDCDSDGNGPNFMFYQCRM